MGALMYTPTRWLRVSRPAWLAAASIAIAIVIVGMLRATHVLSADQIGLVLVVALPLGACVAMMRRARRGRARFGRLFSW
jgi:hypothetical protein